MANEDILGGLRSALTRGYSLEEAMLSLYNAGYKREDIENAARALQTQAPVQSSVVQSPPSIIVAKQKPAPEAKPVKFVQPVSAYVAPPTFEGREEVSKGIWTAKSNEEPAQEVVEAAKPAEVAPIRKEIPQPVQRKLVSSYQSYDSRMKKVMVILVILLAVLMGILGIILIFRQQLIQFFNTIF